MKKEVLFAILIGFAIGLIITYGIYRAQQSYKTVNNTTAEDSSSPPITTPPITTHLIDITFPPNESVSTNQMATIKGVTSPNSYLSAVTTDNQVVTQADSSGNFSIEFPLKIGGNLITLTSIDSNSQSTSQDLFITHTNELSVDVDSPRPTPQAQ